MEQALGFANGEASPPLCERADPDASGIPMKNLIAVGNDC
jgi:hypothetical protein